MQSNPGPRFAEDAGTRTSRLREYPDAPSRRFVVTRPSLLFVGLPLRVVVLLADAVMLGLAQQREGEHSGRAGSLPR